MTVRALETSYAGCRFRSRLEARWAVFFDTIGARWEYEPQGYAINDTPYLPDFRLPDADLWVEVKGTTDRLDRALLRAVAQELGPVLLLGPIPHQEIADPTWLVVQTDHLDWDSDWRGSLHTLATEHRLWGSAAAVSLENDADPLTAHPGDYGSTQVDDAYHAARTARFEHGDTP